MLAARRPMSALRWSMSWRPRASTRSVPWTICIVRRSLVSWWTMAWTRRATATRARWEESRVFSSASTAWRRVRRAPRSASANSSSRWSPKETECMISEEGSPFWSRATAAGSSSSAIHTAVVRWSARRPSSAASRRAWDSRASAEPRTCRAASAVRVRRTATAALPRVRETAAKPYQATGVRICAGAKTSPMAKSPARTPGGMSHTGAPAPGRALEGEPARTINGVPQRSGNERTESGAARRGEAKGGDRPHRTPCPVGACSSVHDSL